MSSFRINNDIATQITNLNTNVESLNASQIYATTSVQSTPFKGINLDNTTDAITKQSRSNPQQPFDTFPYSWPGTNSEIKSLRTFHYNTLTTAWVTWAVSNNIEVFLGFTLANITSELNAFSTDYLAASPTLKTQYDTFIIVMAAGNEQTSVASIIAGINEIKTKRTAMEVPNKPITSVLDLTGTWIQNTFPPNAATFTGDFLTLEPNLDNISFNCYGGYFTNGLNPDITLEASLSWTSNAGVSKFSLVLNQFGAVRAAMAAATITKDFFVTETGWSSQKRTGVPPTAPVDWSTIASERTFYINFLGFSLSTKFVPQDGTEGVDPPERIFYFSVRDVPEFNNEHFGLFTVQESPLVSKVS